MHDELDDGSAPVVQWCGCCVEVVCATGKNHHLPTVSLADELLTATEEPERHGLAVIKTVHRLLVALID